jgi:hypothetical protein
LQNSPKVSADAHRHYLSDNAEPMLNAREMSRRVWCHSKFNCAPFGCEHQTRIGDDRARA